MEPLSELVDGFEPHGLFYLSGSAVRTQCRTAGPEEGVPGVGRTVGGREGYTGVLPSHPPGTHI